LKRGARSAANEKAPEAKGERPSPRVKRTWGYAVTAKSEAQSSLLPFYDGVIVEIFNNNKPVIPHFIIGAGMNFFSGR